jgi:hypothetical protein
MFVYLHGERFQDCSHRMAIAPAADPAGLDGSDPPAEWLEADGETPRQYWVEFARGRAEVPSNIGSYLISRGLAHKRRWSGLILPPQGVVHA